ncbi:WD40-repeat-containing domain protein [Zopfochytrium polystomum]|nr:WD40-repeat-containing domain protein [Zopfochytrium polystomum]
MLKKPAMEEHPRGPAYGLTPTLPPEVCVQHFSLWMLSSCFDVDCRSNTASVAPARAMSQDDALSRLPDEIAARVLSFLADARCLARLCCASRLWSVRAASDAHWQPLFLQRWGPPRRTLSQDDPLDSASNDAAKEKAVRWKDLYRAMRALQDRWKREPPATTTLSSEHGPAVAIHSHFLVRASTSDFSLRIVRRSDWRCVRTLVGHTDQIVAACVDADGRNVLTGSTDTTIRLWDLATGNCVLVIEGFSSPATTLRLTPHGVFAFCRFHSAKLFDRASGALLLDCQSLERIAWSWDASDRGLASLSVDGSVKLWDPAARLCKQVILQSIRDIFVGCVQFDGDRVAVSRGGRADIAIWDCGKDRLVREIDTGCSRFQAFSLVGARLACVAWDVLKVWDVQSGEELQRFAVGLDAMSILMDTSAVLWSNLDGSVVVCEFGTGIPYLPYL